MVGYSIQHLSKCVKNECKFNLLCMKNYRKKTKEISIIKWLIENMALLYWNIYVPIELKKLIFVVYLDILKQNIPKNHHVYHCYFKERCHEFYESFRFDKYLNSTYPFLVGDYCEGCSRHYCKQCCKDVKITKTSCFICRLSL